MELIAAAFPILPGKTEDWRRWIAELNGSRREEFAESRRRLGIHERVFLQATPMGDLVLVTIEGEDPSGAFRALATQEDPFSVWFRDRVREYHGVDLAEVAETPMPEKVLDSAQVAAPVRAKAGG